jgi:hypothetical protein
MRIHTVLPKTEILKFPNLAAFPSKTHAASDRSTGEELRNAKNAINPPPKGRVLSRAI